MKNNQPQINEIINFLDKNDKSQLTELENKYPRFKHLLEPGILMGDDDETYSEEEEYRFRLDVTEKGLNSAISNGNEIFEKLTQKLKKLNNVDFYSQVITLISGSAIVVMLVKGSVDAIGSIKYLAPILVLISSLLSLYAKNKAKSFIGGNEDLYQLTNKFIGYKTEGDHLLKELKIAIKHFSLEKAKPIVEASNSLIKSIQDFKLRAS